MLQANQPAQLANFPDDFAWGVATAAYQIEGGATEGGRGQSIWDTFSHTPGRVVHGHTGDVACDHYHRWPEDIALMRELGLTAYRLSVAWPRIFPDGQGEPNAIGLDWYERLVDALLETGIEPWVTLYHWDLPQALEDLGGWPARGTADAFVRYTEAVSHRLGDRVGHWITLNEPWCSAFLGYQIGEHAPGRRDVRLALQASHTLLLAHGRAVQALRAASPEALIGITLNPTHIEPASSSEADVAAARRYDGYLNRWFLDPLYGRGYPADMLEHYAGRFPVPSDADLRTIAAPIDLLGVNYYQPNVVRHDPHDRLLQTANVHPHGEQVTQMGWIVRPAGLRELLVRIVTDYPVSRLAITENGAAYPDNTWGGRVADPERTRYLADHLAAAAAALESGVPLCGYFAWSLLDNFEWSWGFTRRFGIVHVDFETQRRTVKDSGHWYRDFIGAHGGGQHARPA
jgi:beta-glucosidase